MSDAVYKFSISLYERDSIGEWEPIVESKNIKAISKKELIKYVQAWLIHTVGPIEEEV